jgi:Flp pilus assembly pilin Flp
MNGFEEYTLIIGVIAVLIETVKFLKKKFKSWFEHGHV